MGVQKEKIVQLDANLCHYVISGVPVAWQRTGFSRRTGSMFDTQKAIKNVWKGILKDQHASRPLFMGPLEMNLIFIMPIPLSGSGKKKNREDEYHFFRPDLDNLEKFIKDIGSKVIYHDDCQIALVTKKKIYGLEPRTEIIVRELT